MNNLIQVPVMSGSVSSEESSAFDLYRDDESEAAATIYTSPATQAVVMNDVADEEVKHQFVKSNKSATEFMTYTAIEDDNESFQSQDKSPFEGFAIEQQLEPSLLPPTAGARGKYGSSGVAPTTHKVKVISGDDVIKKAKTLEKYREKLPSPFELVAYFDNDQPLRSHFAKIIKGTGYKGLEFHQWIPLLCLIFSVDVPTSDASYEALINTITSSLDAFVDGGLSTAVLSADDYEKFKGLKDLRSPDDGPVLNRLMIAAKHAWRCTAYGISVPPLSFAVEAGANVSNHPMYTRFLSEGLNGFDLGPYAFPKGASIETIVATYCKNFGIK